MTRKRFVKLLMSQGVSRNRAQELARHTRERGTYKDGYTVWKLQNSLDPLSGALERATEAISKVVSAFGVACSAFSSILSVAMQEPNPFGGVCRRCGGTGVERRMQLMKTFDGPSVRGPDVLGVCPRCLGTGRELV